MGANDPLDGSDADMEFDAPLPALEQDALDRNVFHLAEENRRSNMESSYYVLNAHDCFAHMSESWKQGSHWSGRCKRRCWLAIPLNLI